MITLTPENGSGRQPEHAHLNRQNDAGHLELECAEDHHDDPPLSNAHGPHSMEIEVPRGNVYLFRKSKRASRGAARII
jgi:hypothetical protein